FAVCLDGSRLQRDPKLGAGRMFCREIIRDEHGSEMQKSIVSYKQEISIRIGAYRPRYWMKFFVPPSQRQHACVNGLRAPTRPWHLYLDYMHLRLVCGRPAPSALVAHFYVVIPSQKMTLNSPRDDCLGAQFAIAAK